MSHLLASKCDIRMGGLAARQASELLDQGDTLLCKVLAMMTQTIKCNMCGLNFEGRTGAKTCSPRCRKRRERCLKGKLPATRLKFEQPPNPKASKLWR